MFDNVDWGATILTLVVAFIGSGVISTLILKKHEKEITSLKAKLESDTFITNKQFENELQIYREIWECISSVYVLMNMDINQKYDKDYEFNFVCLNKEFKRNYDNAFKLFTVTFGKYEPFIEESICMEIIVIKKEFEKYADTLRKALWKSNEDYHISSLEEDIDSYPAVLNKEFSNIKIKVREYLRSLKVSK